MSSVKYRSLYVSVLNIYSSQRATLVYLNGRFSQYFS